ncbi:hypothetical protein U9M48_037179 [Paspalum notatum var. saurae]|uniref:Calmodulin-binding domain-containing protein n=1 Tax=Paspalum notatum var. saurae TaxID=547442 RepID=A0AAQ3XC56_PASNO
MTEEVVKEVITSTPASAEPNCENLVISSSVAVNLSSVPPEVKRKEKPVPHYLRASTNSCHDNCKFGIKHSSEPKKYWPVSRKQLRRASTGNQDHDQIRVEIVLPQKARPRKEDQKLKISHVKSGNATAPAKAEFITPKAPLETVPDHPEIIHCVEDLSAEASGHVVAETLPTDAQCSKISHDDMADCGDSESLDGAESIELEMPLAIQDIDESDEHTDDAILPAGNVCGVEEQTLVGHVPDQSANECASSDNRTIQTVIPSEEEEQAVTGTKSESLLMESVKPKAKATSGTRGSSLKSGRASHLTTTRTTVDISNGPKTTRKPADATAATKFSNLERKSRLTVMSVVQKVKETNVPSPSDAADSSVKPARLARLKASTAKTAPSPSPPLPKQTDRKMTGNNVDKKQVLRKKREEKVITGPVKLSHSINMSGKSISSVKLRTVRKEKIAPPIKSSKKVSGIENYNADAKDARQRILKTASPKVRKPEVNNKESGPRKENSDTPRTATTRRAKAAPVTPSSTVSAAPAPRKLTFRRGKVVNPDESSSSTPRRLRFRPAVAAADAAVRSRGVRIGSRRGTSSGAAARPAGAEVIVLRRRQLQDGDEGARKKKQEQGLLNNVIEETASRLVAEARKSKVKALVGAFETVISLQETGKAAAAAAPAGALP